MLNKLRNFSKGKLAGVLVAIIIIPFVFWGMGSVFSGGNTNSIAKINNHNVSTQDFADFINNSKISPEVIRENINNNILEELLTQLVSTSLIDIEIDEFKIFISDEILAKKIKKQKSFQDENNNFSRTKYEKFLLESNMTSVKFEQGIKDNELKKKLFTYIGGGIKSPFFLINNNYKEQLKKIEVDYIDLNSIYINKNEISLDDLKKHINENEEKFLVEKIDISLIKITPENISGETEFTENFFSKIDEIEDLIANNSSIDEISKKYNLEVKIVNEYYPGKESEDLLLHGGHPFYPTNLYLTDLQKCLLNYCTRYPQANEVQEFGVTHYNIQYYPPGGGFKKLHCERGSEGRGKRHLVFMTYLNDLPNGGTEFHYQNIKTEAKKGLTLIFPTDWTHSHKGVISKTHEKYIVTGWYHYGNYNNRF